MAKPKLRRQIEAAVAGGLALGMASVTLAKAYLGLGAWAGVVATAIGVGFVLYAAPAGWIRGLLIWLGLFGGAGAVVLMMGQAGMVTWLFGFLGGCAVAALVVAQREVES